MGSVKNNLGFLHPDFTISLTDLQSTIFYWDSSRSLEGRTMPQLLYTGAHDRNRTGEPLPYQGSALPTELRGRTLFNFMRLLEDG